MGPLHRCVGHPRVPQYHRSLPHVHSKLHASCESSHHVNSQEPAIRLRSRADIRTGRPSAGFNQITCAPPDRLHFDFIRDPCSRPHPKSPSDSIFVNVPPTILGSGITLDSVPSPSKIVNRASRSRSWSYMASSDHTVH